MTMTHFYANSDKFWTHLADSNRMHITARAKHGMLLQVLKDEGVKFSEIEVFMINQSKKCGLNRKIKYNHKTKSMRYLNSDEMRNLAWFREFKNFQLWVKNNFKDYNVPISRVARRNPKPKVVIHVIKRRIGGRKDYQELQVGGPLALDELLNPTETLLREQSSGNTELQADSPGSLQPNTAKKADSSDTADKKVVPITTLKGPIEKDLSLADKQALLLRNLDVLGTIAVEKGAGEEYNLLMEALGMEELFVEIDTNSSLNAAFGAIQK